MGQYKIGYVIKGESVWVCESVYGYGRVGMGMGQSMGMGENVRVWE